MILNEKQRKIFEILKKEKTASNKSLMNKLFISESTLRRDLTHLEKQGVVYRTHGSAILVESSSLESSIHVRVQTQVKEKNSIAMDTVESINWLKKNNLYELSEKLALRIKKIFCQT